jgi:NADH-quinone oxidoreductase subunit F
MRFESIAQLDERRSVLREAKSQVQRRVTVCAGTGCVAGGALELYEDLVRLAHEAGLDYQIALEPCGGKHDNGGPSYISVSGCHGFCQMGPLVHILPDDILYMQVKPKHAADIVEKTFKQNELIEELVFEAPDTKKRQKGREDIAFYNKQTRVALEACGVVDPESIDDYLNHGGYKALTKALTTMKPDQVIAEVEKSGLRGRGGGGFPAGRKWRSAAKAKAENGEDVLYVICNGDEGDPGAFMDRSIMEGDPFKVLEGMTIGAYALGSAYGYIYVRHEYPLAVQRLQKAIVAARAAGLLGDNILGSDFSFDIQINRGGGAFVCGESSALMRSIEGKMGEPRPKYVHSTEKGLYEKPTVLNNVETWVSISPIIDKGADWFASMGTKKSSGTKAFSLVGKVNNTGLVEVPMGISLREIIYDIGGGIIGDKEFKAVQTGGPSGGCLPASKLDLPVDFDTLTDNGSMMGSGGMIVMDNRNCMVDVAKYFINFLIQESCGKCIPCREGLPQLYTMLDRISKGEGRAEDLDQIEKLAEVMKSASLCALGQSSVNPVLSNLKYFREEFSEHISNHKCPAGVCKELITYDINDNCTGCLLCKKACPVEAIAGEKKKKHTLDQEKCTRCGACEAVCRDDAITVE